jgi:S1-C subfamily serine protease
MLRRLSVIAFFGAMSASVCLGNPLALRRSVFRIETISQDLNFVNPWRLQPPGMASGTGFYIGEGRILTNAHVVANASSITVRRDGDARQMTAHVQFIGHDVDLAILGVDDPAYLKNVEALVLGSVPHLRSPVTTVGYPMGGDQISMTDGIVNRISYQTYVHTEVDDHLLVQVDSAINPGNSGGPVFQGRNVVGVAFQALTRAQSTGFIIPVPVVQRFLTDCSNGKYEGVPDWGVETQNSVLNSEAAARFYQVPQNDHRGVLIARVLDWSPAKGIFQRGDVLMSIAGKDIGVDGKVEFEGERVNFEALYDLRLSGDKVRFEVLRQGVIRELTVVARQGRTHQYSGLIYPKRPRFTVFGGIVFTALTRSVMEIWGDSWEKRAPLLMRYLLQNPFDYAVTGDCEKCEELVIVSDILVNNANNFLEVSSPVVDKINGVKVTSVKMLHETLHNLKDETLRLDFLFNQEPWILNSKELRAADAENNRRYGVSQEFWLEPYSVDGAVTKEVKQ